ncbi:hypothetical protein AAFF_G00190350 [Aldrovandia affinis]|uniref:Integrase catalytic domain-containing protein n=1 Tax=Aldrovandia affinis TaxID=143900 RepID=A0AAD7W744_9TELE|nr:hypothetical protein AAFF_G00190350 [Aldrovandia affinis]
MTVSFVTLVQNTCSPRSEDNSGSLKEEKPSASLKLLWSLNDCFECRKWCGKTVIPKMANLPPSSLRLLRPAFYSTGMDCFGPFPVKIGRRNKKRWGIVFKCLTTRAVHIDLLLSIDTDSFLMSLHWFIARRGKPHELLSDYGTNFRGGNTELQKAFNALHPSLQDQLSAQRIHFRYNPSNAPHFGGSWEREVR